MTGLDVLFSQISGTKFRFSIVIVQALFLYYFSLLLSYKAVSFWKKNFSSLRFSFPSLLLVVSADVNVRVTFSRVF